MAYDEGLAERIRDVLVGTPGLSERRMFGGLAFLVTGHMAVAAGSQGGLLLRVDPEQTDDLVDGVHVRRYVMRGREMDGWLGVDAEAIGTEQTLERWIAHGITYAASLPPK